MNKKRILIFGIVLVALCLLIYLQIRSWKTFDWPMFWNRTEHVSWLYVFYGLALTYLAYVLRAVRWRIFLKPVRKTTTARLLAPQFVGFAALALLGRAGEMIRLTSSPRKNVSPSLRRSPSGEWNAFSTWALSPSCWRSVSCRLICGHSTSIASCVKRHSS